MNSARVTVDPTSHEHDATRLAVLAEHFDATDASDVAWEEAAEVEIQRPELERISVRLPRGDISELKRRAGQAGISYTTLIRMIVRQHLRNPLVR